MTNNNERKMYLYKKYLLIGKKGIISENILLNFTYKLLLVLRTTPNRNKRNVSLRGWITFSKAEKKGRQPS